MADEALQLIRRNVDRFRQRGSVVLSNQRWGARHSGFQAADFVPIAWFFTIEVAQSHLNPKQAITETLQRSRDNALNPSNQLFVAADVVVTIDQDLHSSISSGSQYQLSRK
jgi:hypothetical protein